MSMHFSAVKIFSASCKSEFSCYICILSLTSFANEDYAQGEYALKESKLMSKNETEKIFMVVRLLG